MDSKDSNVAVVNHVLPIPSLSLKNLKCYTQIRNCVRVHTHVHMCVCIKVSKDPFPHRRPMAGIPQQLWYL